MNTSHLLVFVFSIMVTMAHFVLSILKPQSADLKNLLRPASPASLMVALGTYYSIAALLWTSLQSFSGFFSIRPSVLHTNENEKKEVHEAIWTPTVEKEMSRYLTCLGMAFAASLVIYLDILRVWYRGISAAWIFSHLAPNPDAQMKVISHVVFCTIATSTSITAGIVSLLPSYAMGHILSIGREARVKFVEKLRQPVVKPWEKRKGE